MCMCNRSLDGDTLHLQSGGRPSNVAQSYNIIASDRTHRPASRGSPTGKSGGRSVNDRVVLIKEMRIS